MKKTDISQIYKNLKNYDGKEITIAGWVRSARDLKNFAFLTINDGTSFKCAQLIANTSTIENYADVCKLNAGSSVVCKGKVVATPNNPQPFEIETTSVEIISATDETYPLQKKKHSIEFLREVAYLRPRTNLFNAVFKIRSESAFALHKFFNEEGFVYTHTPIITAADCEGGSDVFRVTTFNPYTPQNPQNIPNPKDDFFGKPVFLTPTGQLEGEAFALAFGKIYTFGPTFRSENSNTARHASEFWMIEPEIAFADLSDNMDIIEKMVKYLINYLLNSCKDEFEFLNKFIDTTLLERLNKIVNSNFVRVTYTEAIKLLQESGEKFEFKVEWGIDLQSEHEKYLCEKIYGCPVFLTDYPKEIKAFYMRLNDDNKTVAACDLLVPGVGEMVGGSQREERLDVLLQKLKDCKLKEEDYWWYVNLRKYGSVVHSGYGLGFERFLMYVTGISNIRDVQLFPRTPQNCDF